MFSMKKTMGIVLGALLIAVGALAILDVCDIVPFDVSFDGWWTVFIIVPAIESILTSRDKTGGFIFLTIGVYLLLAARDIIEYELFWKLIIPVIIVIVGIKLIVKTITGEKNETRKEEKDGDSMNVGAVFGGTKCNLTDVDFEKMHKVNLFCIFGGAELIVPEDVRVNVNTFSLFGGINDKRVPRNEVLKTRELTVNGLCLFGGADIK